MNTDEKLTACLIAVLALLVLVLVLAACGGDGQTVAERQEEQVAYLRDHFCEIWLANPEAIRVYGLPPECFPSPVPGLVPPSLDLIRIIVNPLPGVTKP